MWFERRLFVEFPNCVRAIDGTQIPIYAPYVHPEQYINYKKFFSIYTQIVVNHRGAITHLSARFPGGTHDSRLLQESYLQDVLDRNILGQYYLIGDQGYKCQTNLIAPYSTWPYKPMEEEAYFNKCLAKTRVKVECVIDMWKKKFPGLTVPLHYQPEVVCEQQEPVPRSLADKIILEAEKLKANVATPKGNKLNFFNLDGLKTQWQQLELKRFFDSNDNFFHITCRVD